MRKQIEEYQPKQQPLVMETMRRAAHKQLTEQHEKKSLTKESKTSPQLSVDQRQMSQGSKPALQSYYPKSISPDMQASSIFPISLELQKRQDSSMMRALAMQGYHRPSLMGPPPHLGPYEKYSTSMMPEDFMRLSLASGKKEVGKISVSKLPSSSDHSQRKSTPTMRDIPSNL